MDSPPAATRRSGRHGWRGIVSVATVAGLASLGCDNKARRQYPTINATTTPDGGNVNVRGDYNYCPTVLFVASPDHAPVGHPITLTASASDRDDDPLSYAWKASSGTISNPAAATTTFTCTENGAVTITLTVSDPSCPSATSGSVICQPGDGGVADRSASGAGGASGTGGGGSGPGGGGGGGTTTGTGGSLGMAGRGGTGGGGAAGAAGTSGAGGTGGTACLETSPPSSLAAGCSSCIAQFAAPNEGCCALATADPTGFALCQTVSACMRNAGCNLMGDTSGCHCGTNPGTCDMAGQANGPCRAEVTAAAGRDVESKMTDTPTPAQVLTRFGDTKYAIGRATSVHSFAGAFCSIECGVGM
jgi:hypothetical protein